MKRTNGTDGLRGIQLEHEIIGYGLNILSALIMVLLISFGSTETYLINYY